MRLLKASKSRLFAHELFILMLAGKVDVGRRLELLVRP